MRLLRILIALGILTLSTGCQQIVSLHPLYTEEDLVSEPALEGFWVLEGNGEFAMIKATGSDSYQITYTMTEIFKGGGESQYEAHLVRLGDHLFLDIFPDERAMEELSDKQVGYPIIWGHTFLRIEIEEDVLRVTFLESEWMEKKIRSEELKLVHELKGGDLIVIAAPTRELQAFFAKYGDDSKAFHDPGEFHRRPLEVGYVHRGEFYSNEDLNEKAIAAYKKALEIKPDYAKAYRGLAEVYRDEGRYDEAIAACKKALAINPEYAEAYQELGFAYSGKGEWRGWESSSAFDMALVAASNDVDALESIAYSFRWTGFHERAIVAYERLLKLEPEHSEARKDLAHLYNLKAETHRKFGLYEEAVSWSKRALVLDPDRESHRRDLGMTLIFLENYDQGRKELRKARDLSARSPRGVMSVGLHLGFSYFLQNRIQEAVGEFEKSGPNVGGIWWYLALGHLGREEEARKRLEEYVLWHFVDPEFPGWEMALGLFHQGKLSEADLLSRIHNRQQQCEGFFHIGYRAFFQDDKRKAQKYFQQAVDTKAFDQFEFAAARARLEQLGSK